MWGISPSWRRSWCRRERRSLLQRRTWGRSDGVLPEELRGGAAGELRPWERRDGELLRGLPDGRELREQEPRDARERVQERELRDGRELRMHRSPCPA